MVNCGRMRESRMEKSKGFDSMIDSSAHSSPLRRLPRSVGMTNHYNMQQQPQQKQIQIADNIPGAEYANAMQVSHNKDEFQMILFSILPPSGKVSAKIITTPGHFKRMVNAMVDNLKKYEEKFGKIKEAENVHEEIGFKAK